MEPVFRSQSGKRTGDGACCEQWRNSTLRTAGIADVTARIRRRRDPAAAIRYSTFSVRPVRFLKYYDKVSTIIGGDHIAGELQRRGFDARVITPEELPAVREAIVVFIKTSRFGDLVRARLQENLLVADVHDTLVFKRRLKYRRLYHGAIFRNRRQLADYSVPRQVERVIPHQGDPRYVPNEVPSGEFRLAYLGDPRSISFFGLHPEIPSINSDFFEQAKRFNCHLSLREGKRDFLYKPNLKVSTAAACHAALITTRDVSTIELLGEDYPYYTEADIASVERTIERARATLGGPEWNLALRKLDAAREVTRLEHVVDEYVAFFEELETRFAP